MSGGVVVGSPADLSIVGTLSAEDLDRLILAAAERRSSLQPSVPNQVPQSWSAAINPQWRVSLSLMGTLFQMRHPGYGWVSFVVPPAERASLIGLLTSHALAPPMQVQPIGNRKEKRKAAKKGKKT